MNQRVWIGICAGVLLTLTGAARSLAAPPGLSDPDAATDQAGQSDDIVVDYVGKLQDEHADPISGVFQLEFNLYDTQKSADPAWTERQYVAVVDGSYIVPLGSRRDLSRAQIPDDAWIGIELVGEGQILRDRFELGQPGATDSSGTAENSTQGGVSAATKRLLKAARDNKKVAFADVAERAVAADKAEVAERANKLGDLTAEQIEQKTELALDRLGKHIADPNAHQATGGIRLSNERSPQRRVGGSGGKSYRVQCPPGSVVTGIKGGAGRLVDSFQIICQKLR